ncbi:hypothetical protein DWG18_06435 [Lysobacter sp. TY2-98]|uniref:TfoX/Sxy family protein n=1 Tax=Lysobacter sp. TY2-98 TaxID=2290922 RepID=UPI000E202638|nr:TfoX/Sxy family protein [Lysobacter sp. TY2-98]AXK71956.1 hypothetical protein DWG18_06435 [Lysobacter sp. TY2-98]
MATDPGTVEFLLDQLGTRGASYSTRRMFGEYCLYREGAPVAFVCDDVLFIKDTSAGRASMTAAGVLDFGPPYPGAKDYLRLPPDGWDDGDWLRKLLDATAAELPVPRAKGAPRAKKTAAAKKTIAKKNTGAVKKSTSRTAGQAPRAAKKSASPIAKKAAAKTATKTTGKHAATPARTATATRAKKR